MRGAWPLTFSGNSPSGLCSLGADFGQTVLPGTSVPGDPSQWHQCAAPPVNDLVRTQDYPQGANKLHIAAFDAAARSVDYTRTVNVDNQAPGVSLTGPPDAPSSAGIQHVTATATAGPSGVRALACSVDGGPAQSYIPPVARVAVSGIGPHQIGCQAKNNALNASGYRAVSAPVRFTMKIGTPTVTAVGFTKLVGGLRCHRSRARVTRCHVRSVRRHVSVWVLRRRHGRRVRIRERKVTRVLLGPHRRRASQRVVGHGRAARVDGWLGTTTGRALAHRRVEVLTKPDNGNTAYHQAAVATTRADGSWSVQLRAGPSRLITAAYAGSPTTEGSLASPVHLIVPAKVELRSVSPRHVAWGGTIRLVGQLRGGYLPRGGALVRLRIGLGGAFTTFGVHEHVGGRGRFTTTYTFGAGFPGILRTYWFQIASLPMGDYPFAPASSRRESVVVGGHPQHATRHR
ncbi:MAG: hypothetical protein M3016_08380 [Actinomycetota bacterium]|nr:hypothetical protein [Actinomycetota bacterium]